MTDLKAKPKAKRTAPKELKAFEFKPGQSGNPKGRPKGSRNALGEAFIEAMHKDFQEHGETVIAEVRNEKPEQYLKVIASIIPKELNVNTNAMEEMSDDELAGLLDTVKQLAVAGIVDEVGKREDPAGKRKPLKGVRTLQ